MWNSSSAFSTMEVSCSKFVQLRYQKQYQFHEIRFCISKFDRALPTHNSIIRSKECKTRKARH